MKQLRGRGKRKSDREIGAAPLVEGELPLAILGHMTVLDVREPNNHVASPLLPTFYEARLIAMHTGGMLFKGEERPQNDAGLAYVQSGQCG